MTALAAGQLKGHWRLDVYQGDIVREEVPLRLRLANLAYRAEAKARRRLPRRLHLGRITNELVEVIEGDNLVTTAGKALLLDRLYNNAGAGAAVNSMGVGTEALAAAIGDTKLNPSGGGTVFIQAFDAQATRAGLVETMVCTYTTAQANFQWQELGTFNGVTNGTSALFNRIAPIGPFTKSAAVSIVVTVTVTQS
jgi:hypothetical protein